MTSASWYVASNLLPSMTMPVVPELDRLMGRFAATRLLGAALVIGSLSVWCGPRHVAGAPPAATDPPAAPRDDAESLQAAFDLRTESLRLSTQGKFAAAAAKADEALALIRGDTPLARHVRAALLDTRALAHLQAGDQASVAADALAAAAIWRGLGEEQAESLAGSLLNAGFALNQTKQFEEATAALVEARDILVADPAWRDTRLLQTLSLLSTAAGEVGDNRLATDALADYVRLAAELGNRGDAAFATHLRLLGFRLLAAAPADPRQLDLWADEAIAAELTADDTTVLGEMVTKLSQGGDYARSRRLAERLARWLRDRQPRDPVGLAAVLEKVGEAAGAAGDFAAAQRAFREACSLLEAGHPREHAIMLSHLAGFTAAMGEYVAAEADYTRAVGTLATLEGPDRLFHAQALGGLGMVNLQLGDVPRARARLVEAVKKSEAVGESAVAVSGNLLVQLAIAEGLAGDIAAARRSFARGRSLITAAFGADHPLLLVYDQVQAGLELDAGNDLAAAETLLAGVIERLARLPGGGGLIRAQASEMLAEATSRRGDRDRALALLTEARTLRETGGDDHSLVFVRTLLQTAEVRGLDDPVSRADVERALDLCDALLGPVFATLSERQQIAAAAVAHRALGVAAALPPAAEPREAAAFHDRVLRWKGTIFARQREIRRTLADPQAAAVAAELRDVAGRIAAAALQPGSATDDAVTALTDRRDTLERLLAGAAGGSSRSVITTTAVAEALPPGVVLVDFLESAPVWTGGAQPQKQLTAFVIRHGRDTVRIDLGAASEVRDALDRWRPWQAEPPANSAAAAAALRRLVWLPLEPHLTGAAVVLVSPDGSLGELPFAALPGRAPGSVLLDEVLIAHVPVPSLVPELLARPRPADGGGGMLLVGDVDFGAAGADSAAGPALVPVGFPELPGTQAEVEAIATMAATHVPPVMARRLEGAAATVEAVRTGLAEARFVHLATHGFFADAPAAGGLTRGIAGTAALAPFAIAPRPAGDAGLGGLHPGALSGIVLAGVNGRRGSAGGILTALEVADLDLGEADLVVLSACDTRRGRAAAGEGLLGLQRAFEVAGARSVVASLWQVNDAATAALMQEFYRNLWQRRLPRGEALRQAQRHVAREYSEGTAGSPAGPRGVAGTAPLPGSGPLPPAYWAGFVLSGDWR